MRRTLFLAGALVFGLAACSSSTTSDDGPLTGSTMSAKIDGTNFTPATTLATYMGGILTVSGANLTQGSIAFSMMITQAGTYPIATGSFLTATISNPANALWTAAGASGSGQVVVTSFTANSAKGTFNFTAPASGAGATGTKTVTNGTFSVKF